MLVLAIKEVLRNLDLLVFLETSLDPVGNALSFLEVKLHVDFVAGTVAEALKDLVLLRLTRLFIDLLSAVSPIFEGLEKLGVLTFSLCSHLVSQISFKVLKLVKKSLLLILVIVALGNLDLHGFASLKDFELLR